MPHKQQRHQPVVRRFNLVVSFIVVVLLVLTSETTASHAVKQRLDSTNTIQELPGSRKHIQHAIWQLLPITLISVLTCIYDETTRTWIRRQRIALQPPWDVFDVYPNNTIHFHNNTLLFPNGSMLVLDDGSEIKADGSRGFINGTHIRADGVEFVPPYIDTRTCAAVETAHCGIVAPMSWYQWLWPFSGPSPIDIFWRWFPLRDEPFVESGWTVDGQLPVMYPRNDEELRWVVAQVSSRGCRIRAYDNYNTRSRIDDVTLPNERFYTVALSLLRYDPPIDWSLSSVSEASLLQNEIVRGSAGASFFDVMKAIRASGYMLPTQPSSWAAASLGHMTTSMLHGSSMEHGFVHQHVRALRVMDARGDIRIVSTPRELALWRLSYGLHGILTAVELEVVARHKLRMSTWSASESTVGMSKWTADDTRRYDYFVSRVQAKTFASEFVFEPQSKSLFAVSSAEALDRGGTQVHHKIAKSVVKSARRLSDRVLGGFIKDSRRHECIGCGQYHLERDERERKEEYAQEERQKMLYEKRRDGLALRLEQERQLELQQQLEQRRIEERKFLEEKIRMQEEQLLAQQSGMNREGIIFQEEEEEENEEGGDDDGDDKNGNSALVVARASNNGDNGDLFSRAVNEVVDVAKATVRAAALNAGEVVEEAKFTASRTITDAHRVVHAHTTVATNVLRDATARAADVAVAAIASSADICESYWLDLVTATKDWKFVGDNEELTSSSAESQFQTSAVPYSNNLHHPSPPSDLDPQASLPPVVEWAAHNVFKSLRFTHDDNCTWDIFSFGCSEPKYCYISPQPLTLSLCRVREKYRAAEVEEDHDERFPHIDGFDDDRYPTDAFEDDSDIFRTTVNSATQTSKNYWWLSFWGRGSSVAGLLEHFLDSTARAALFLGSCFPGETQTYVRSAVFGPRIHAHLRARVQSNRQQVNDGFYDMDIASWWDQKSQRTMAYFVPISHISEALSALVHTQASFETLEMTARVTYLQIDPADTWLLPQTAHTGVWVCVRVDVAAEAWWWGWWDWLWGGREEEGKEKEGVGGEWSRALMELEFRWNSMIDVPVFPHLSYLFAFGFPRAPRNRDFYSSSTTSYSTGSIFSWSTYYDSFETIPNFGNSYYGYAYDNAYEQAVLDENELLYGYPLPFKNIALVEGLLTDEYRRDFLKYRQEQDPDAVFWGGRMSDMLLARLFREYSGFVPEPKSWWRQLVDFVWMVVVS